MQNWSNIRLSVLHFVHLEETSKFYEIANYARNSHVSEELDLYESKQWYLMVMNCIIIAMKSSRIN